MDKVKILRDVCIVLAALCLFLGAEYFLLYRENQTLKKSANAQQINQKVLAFNKMFVEKVLTANDQVSFEDRLKLENAVRNLNDPVVFSAWEDFVNSKTESQAQQSVKKLLGLLCNKVSY